MYTHIFIGFHECAHEQLLSPQNKYGRKGMGDQNNSFPLNLKVP
jgi:hypothetical protein